jgi:hypothetical protein
MVTSLLAFAVLAAPAGLHQAPQEPMTPNTLSPEETREGFALLFDGKDLSAWRGFRQQEVPSGWQAVDGELRFVPGSRGGDLVTREQYEDFDLRLDWKIAPRGNSGIMFRSTEDKRSSYETGPEYQILDDDLARDGRNPLTSAGANYALHAPSKNVLRPVGAWNETRILVKGNHVEHWLNGVKIVEYELHSEDWKKRVAGSKFRDMPDYGQRKVGHIVLQDHGTEVAFQNLRIRKL